MAGILPNDFTKIMHNGYYFDCCVDLYFYGSKTNDAWDKEKKNSFRKLLYRIKTPPTGLKPEINIAGSIISNTIDVGVTVAIKNLSYEVDIDRVEAIIADMYYGGLQSESAKTALGMGGFKGHAMELTVVWAEQQGEPPDRYVKFHCEIAASDYTRVTKPIFINKDKMVDTTEVDSYTRTGGYVPVKQMKEVVVDGEAYVNTTDAYKNTILGWLIKLANIYNKSSDDFNYSRGSGEVTEFKEINSGTKITKIVYNGLLIDELNLVAKDEVTDFNGIRKTIETALATMVTKKNYANIFTVTFNSNEERGVLRFQSHLTEADVYGHTNRDGGRWIEGCIQEPYRKYFHTEAYDGGKKYENQHTFNQAGMFKDIVVDIQSSSKKAPVEKKVSAEEEVMVFESKETVTYKKEALKEEMGLTPDNPIPINFVKSAFKNQVYMTMKILFDDRIYPDCWCKIAGKLLMGKNGLGTNNLTSFKEQTVIFQVVGEIRFNFSTVNGATMEFASVASQTVTENEAGNTSTTDNWRAE